MLEDKPEPAKYYWTHCLTLPHAAWVLCGSRKFHLGEDGYAKSDLPWNSPTKVARLHAWAEDVDRLLDQFDSHLSPLRTGMVSTDFRLRAVRTGDGDRRLAGELRSVQALAAAQPAIPASPCPMRGAF